MKLEKKYIVLSIITIAILFGSVAYAFFKANIISDGKQVSLKSKRIYLMYNGELDIASGYIEPGWSMTKTFTVENQGNNTETYDIYIKDLVNTFETEGYLQYKITSANGYNMADYKDIPKSAVATYTVLARSVSIDAKTTHTYTIELIYSNTTEDQSADMGKTLSGTLNIKEGTLEPTLLGHILADNPTVSTRSDFSVTNVANTTGTIYTTTATEDGSTVYYYSGNTTNNWVYFGGFYWRIIRTNEDGSVRLLYSGTSPDTTEGYIGTSVYNYYSGDPMYVGYMYGTKGSLANNRTNTNDSTVKQIIDTWYENNLLTDYDKYISKTAIYCNDRSIGSGTYNTGSTTFDYGAYTRLEKRKTPTYKCGGNTTGGLFATADIADKFSASTSGGGNGQLQYPIALMTADEVAYAGGKARLSLISPYAWYYTNAKGESITGNHRWWTMAPYFWNGYSSRSDVWDVYGSFISGCLSLDYVDLSVMVRPSVSLKSCNLISEGDGTASNPYKINYEESCTE